MSLEKCLELGGSAKLFLPHKRKTIFRYVNFVDVNDDWCFVCTREQTFLTNVSGARTCMMRPFVVQITVYLLFKLI